VLQNGSCRALGGPSTSAPATRSARPKIDSKRSVRNAPVYVAEYWDGWFDHWGEKHQVTDAAKQETEIRSMLEQGDSISLYMVHGGTTSVG